MLRESNVVFPSKDRERGGSRVTRFHLQGEAGKNSVQSGANRQDKASKDGQAVHATLAPRDAPEEISALQP